MGTVVALLLLLSAPSVPQGTVAVLPTLDLPTESGAWVLRVETSGGFTGRGTGSVTMSSAGDLACVAPSACAPQLDTKTRRALDALVARAGAADVPERNSPSSSVCNDCVTTTLTLRQRGRQGVERVAVYSWTEVTAAAVPDDIRHLRSAALALASAW